uniref:Ataxin-2 C-terminal domain-containing protein n=1 Tax=Megaselia scalaris TaxID=36166 RepID=T1GA90_MEGSC
MVNNEILSQETEENTEEPEISTFVEEITSKKLPRETVEISESKTTTFVEQQVPEVKEEIKDEEPISEEPKKVITEKVPEEILEVTEPISEEPKEVITEKVPEEIVEVSEVKSVEIKQSEITPEQDPEKVEEPVSEEQVREEIIEVVEVSESITTEIVPAESTYTSTTEQQTTVTTTVVHSDNWLSEQSTQWMSTTSEQPKWSKGEDERPVIDTWSSVLKENPTDNIIASPDFGTITESTSYISSLSADAPEFKPSLSADAPEFVPSVKPQYDIDAPEFIPSSRRYPEQDPNTIFITQEQVYSSARQQHHKKHHKQPKTHKPRADPLTELVDEAIKQHTEAQKNIKPKKEKKVPTVVKEEKQTVEKVEKIEKKVIEPAPEAEPVTQKEEILETKQPTESTTSFSWASLVSKPGSWVDTTHVEEVTVTESAEEKVKKPIKEQTPKTPKAKPVKEKKAKQPKKKEPQKKLKWKLKKNPNPIPTIKNVEVDQKPTGPTWASLIKEPANWVDTTLVTEVHVVKEEIPKQKPKTPKPKIVKEKKVKQQKKPKVVEESLTESDVAVEKSESDSEPIKTPSKEIDDSQDSGPTWASLIKQPTEWVDTIKERKQIIEVKPVEEKPKHDRAPKPKAKKEKVHKKKVVPQEFVSTTEEEVQTTSSDSDQLEESTSAEEHLTIENAAEEKAEGGFTWASLIKNPTEWVDDIREKQQSKKEEVEVVEKPKPTPRKQKQPKLRKRPSIDDITNISKPKKQKRQKKEKKEEIELEPEPEITEPVEFHNEYVVNVTEEKSDPNEVEINKTFSNDSVPSWASIVQSSTTTTVVSTTTNTKPKETKPKDTVEPIKEHKVPSTPKPPTQKHSWATLIDAEIKGEDIDWWSESKVTVSESEDKKLEEEVLKAETIEDKPMSVITKTITTVTTEEKLQESKPNEQEQPKAETSEKNFVTTEVKPEEPKPKEPEVIVKEQPKTEEPKKAAYAGLPVDESTDAWMDNINEPMVFSDDEEESEAVTTTVTTTTVTTTTTTEEEPKVKKKNQK